MTPLPFRTNSPLYKKIKKYKKRMAEMAVHLQKNPHEWGLFQSEFNREIQSIFQEFLLFEQESLEKRQEEKVFNLKSFFIKKLRKEFLRGELIRRSLEKPQGYPGDFKIIDAIYQNDPKSTGLERLFDNYFLTSAFSVAVRNRKEDFKRIIQDFIRGRSKRETRILDLTAGPGRLVHEVISQIDKEKFIEFHCYDSDDAAIEYGKRLIYPDTRVYFFRHNPVRIAMKQDIDQLICHSYDLIVSTSAFEYLDDHVSNRLVRNLKRILKPGGMMAVSDVRDKFSNPSIYFMEWVADWNLIYRGDEVFRDFFSSSGFSSSNVKFGYEQQGVMQYAFASKE